MILGMSLGAFTLLHVIITLVAIGSGLIVVGGMFASHKLPGTTVLFLFTTALTSVTGFLFSHSGLHAGSRCRYRCLLDLGGRAFCLIQRAIGRRMALDLRDHRNRIALFKRLCSGRSKLHEGSGPKGVGADAVGAAVRDNAGCHVGGFRCDHAHRFGQFQAGHRGAGVSRFASAPHRVRSVSLHQFQECPLLGA